MCNPQTTAAPFFLYYHRMNIAGTSWYRFVRSFCGRVIFRLTGGFEVKGAENVPSSGPLLVTPTHYSNFDPPAVAAALRTRALSFMAKEELFRFPGVSHLIRSLNAFPFARGKGDTEAIRKAISLLQEGRAVLVFPEGTRGDGITMGLISPGIGVFARKSDAWVLPIAIVGSHITLGKGRLFPKRNKIVVSIGKPFKFAEATSLHPELDARQAFTRELEQRLLDLSAAEGLHLKTAPRTTPPVESDSVGTSTGAPCSEPV